MHEDMEFLEVLTEGLSRVLMVRGGGNEVITMYSWSTDSLNVFEICIHNYTCACMFYTSYDEAIFVLFNSAVSSNNLYFVFT